MHVQISQTHSSGGAASGSNGSEMSMGGDLMVDVDSVVLARALALSRWLMARS